MAVSRLQTAVHALCFVIVGTVSLAETEARAQGLDLRGTKRVEQYLKDNLSYYPGAVRQSNRPQGTCKTDANGWPMSFDFTQIPWWMRYEDFQREFVHELRSCGAEVKETPAITQRLAAEVFAIGLKTPQGDIFDVKFEFRAQYRRDPGGSGASLGMSLSTPVRCKRSRIGGCAVTNWTPNFGLTKVTVQGRPAAAFGNAIARVAGRPVQKIEARTDYVPGPGGLYQRNFDAKVGGPFYDLRTAEASVPYIAGAMYGGSFAKNSYETRNIDVPTLVISRRSAEHMPSRVMIPRTVPAGL